MPKASCWPRLNRWEEAEENLPERLQPDIRHDWLANLLRAIILDLFSESNEAREMIEEPLGEIDDPVIPDYYRCWLALLAMRDGDLREAMRRLQSTRQPPALANVLTAHLQCVMGETNWPTARKAIPDKPPHEPFLEEYLKALDKEAQRGNEANAPSPDELMFDLQRKMLLLSCV